MPKFEYFITRPSERSLEEWVVYEITNPRRPLFFGPEEAAEYDASRRNAQAREAYSARQSAEFLQAYRSDAEQRSKAFMEMVERRTAMLERGLENDTCLAALSLPG